MKQIQVGVANIPMLTDIRG